MRIRTILIAGVPLAILLAVIGFHLGHRSEPHSVSTRDRGYLSAIEPPSTLSLAPRTAAPGTSGDEQSDRLSPDQPEASSAPPPPTRRSNRWALARVEAQAQEAEPEPKPQIETRTRTAAQSTAEPTASASLATTQTDEAAPTGDAAPTEEPVPSEETPPAQGAASAEDTAPSEQAPPPEEAAPTERTTTGDDDSAPEEAVRRYTIRAGDTLASIAVMHYGDASKWRLVARVNPAINPKQLQIGQVVILPPISRDGDGAEQDQNARRGEVLAIHTVDQGDSLYSLARRYYGDGTRWPAIRKANPGLRGASLFQLKLGSQLVIPVIETGQAAN